MACGSKKVKKLADSSGNSEDPNEITEQDLEIQKIIEEIDHSQNVLDSLNEQASEEILKVEQKFNKLRKPHFDKRGEKISKVPYFWGTSISNHPVLGSLLEDNEDDCLHHHLLKLEVEEFDDIISGYRINFYFEENPYFENTVITKEFHLGSPDEPTSQSTPINWKAGMDFTQPRSPRCPKSGRKRSLEQKSFFSWFNDHADPSSDDIAEIIKDDLWLNPLQYYLIADIDVENGVEDDDSEADDDDDAEIEPSVVGDTTSEITDKQ